MDVTTIPQLPRLDQIRVEEVMRVGVIACNPDTPLAAIARIFADERIHCVVVHGIERTREGERMTWGIIHDHDLVRAVDAGDGSLTAGRLAMPAHPTVDLDEPLDVAVQLMASYGVTHVLVVNKDYPVGIVSALDVARAAAAV